MNSDKKPTTVSLKLFLIRKMTADMIIPQATIEAVVNHQFGMMLEMMKSKKSVEISGFGKFVFNEKRAIKKWKFLMAKKKLSEDILSDPYTSDVKRRNSQLKLNTTMDSIKVLKPMLYEYFASVRGMEEQADSTQSSEIKNTGSS